MSFTSRAIATAPRLRSTWARCGSPRATRQARASFLRRSRSPRGRNSFSERVDPFDNRVARMRIETAHRELVIKAASRVAVERPAPPLPALTPTWEMVAALARETSSLAADSPVFAIYPSRLIPLFDAADALRPREFSARAADLRSRPRAQRAHPARLRLRRQGDRGENLAGRSVQRQTRRLPGLCPGDDRRAARPWAPRCYVSGYIRTNPPPESRGCRAPTPRTPGSKCGVAPPSAGSASTPPTPFPRATTTSSSRAGATIPTWRRWKARILSYGGHELDVEVDVVPVQDKPHVER